MSMFRTPAFAAGVIAAGLLICVASSASAQGMLGSGGAAVPSPVRAAPNLPAGRPQEPPALPGAAARPGESNEHVTLDLPPTEALFDSINRGDIVTARDAIQRGADLSGRNVLGMTPLDLSIDLSRNDITFLLLSMRSQASISGPSPDAVAASDTAHGTAAAKPTTSIGTAAKARRPEVTARGRSGTPTPRFAALPAPMPIAAHAAQAAPSARYAGSGGTPIPQAGFLGFGATAQQ